MYAAVHLTDGPEDAGFESELDRVEDEACTQLAPVYFGQWCEGEAGSARCLSMGKARGPSV